MSTVGVGHLSAVDAINPAVPVYLCLDHSMAGEYLEEDALRTRWARGLHVILHCLTSSANVILCNH